MKLKEHARAYSAWKKIRQRCFNDNDPKWPSYGGRGISVCDRWSNFEAFLADMGLPPEGYSIDRIDNDGDYEPSNCRWASYVDQARNTRRNRVIAANGQTLCVKEWAEQTGISQYTILTRLNNGWHPEKAVSHPIDASKRNKRASAHG